MRTRTKIHILTIVILLLLTLSLSAQKNIISVCLQPIDLGIGLKYDRQLKHVGVYVSASDGIYHMLRGTVHNYRIAAGLSTQLSPSIKSNPFISLGFVYHRYFRLDQLLNIEKKTWKQYSFEFGISNKIERFNIGVRYDPIRNESSIDFGYRF
jgi:hypothetical protein